MKDVSRFQIGTVNERVILCIRDTGSYEQFWCCRALGSLSMRYLWEVEAQMSRMDLEVQIQTEDLGVAINLFSA